MSDIFIKILNMSISASWMILAVIVMRLILKKAPKWLMCLLWGLVAIKLIVPYTPESIVSLIPSGEVIPENITEMAYPHINSGIVYVDNTVNPMMQTNLAPQIGDSANPMQVIIYIAGMIWCIGLVISLVYAMMSYIILKRKVRASKRVRKNIYSCDEVSSPFILGLFRPVIYIPSGMKDEVIEYVVAHEYAHLKRGDHFWKPLGFTILSVYWFNPLCWIAYILLCRDIEYACDEKVIRDKDREFANSYSQALLDCNAQRKIIAACPLAFGETDVKGRIKGILNYNKPAFWIIIVSLIACIVVAICFMTRQKQQEPGRIPPELFIGSASLNDGVSATVRSYTWAEDSIGNDEVMPFEDLHPELDHSIANLKLDVVKTSLVLDFSEEPDEVLIMYWEEKYVDDGGELGEGSVQITYNTDDHMIDIPANGNLYFTVRASWTNRGGASYAFHIDRDEASDVGSGTINQENVDDADVRIGTAYAEYSAVVTEVTYDPEKGYSVVVTDSTNPGEYYGEYYGLGIVYVIVGDEIKVGDRIGEYWRPIDASEIRTDVCELYLEVLEDLWNVDSGLNDGISQIGIDLSELSHLTELEKETVMHEFASRHFLPYIAGTWEELCEQGYIDKDNLYWKDGLFFSINTNEDAVWNLPSIAYGDPIPELTSFDAYKWRGGLGAYYFDQCTAQKNAEGKWSYTVGQEAIS